MFIGMLKNETPYADIIVIVPFNKSSREDCSQIKQSRIFRPTKVNTHVTTAHIFIHPNISLINICISRLIDNNIFIYIYTERHNRVGA